MQTEAAGGTSLRRRQQPAGAARHGQGAASGGSVDLVQQALTLEGLPGALGARWLRRGERPEWYKRSLHTPQAMYAPLRRRLGDGRAAAGAGRTLRTLGWRGSAAGPDPRFPGARSGLLDAARAVWARAAAHADSHWRPGLWSKRKAGAAAPRHCAAPSKPAAAGSRLPRGLSECEACQFSSDPNLRPVLADANSASAFSHFKDSHRSRCSAPWPPQQCCRRWRARSRPSRASS